MCIFSQPVEHVAGTKIFARRHGSEQLLAYEMSFAAAGDLAMVLPLPVVPRSGEAALRFIDLSGHMTSPFRVLEALFPEELSVMASGSVDAQPKTLEVHRVGAFDASFVPTIGDFSRLDRRFRVSDEVWAELPQYRDFGFAVFKLHGKGRSFVDRLLRRPKEASGGRVHPMGLAFQSRDPERLFFSDRARARRGGAPRGPLRPRAVLPAAPRSGSTHSGPADLVVARIQRDDAP